MPPPQNQPRRRNSLIGQWDTTTKVVNVKNRYYSTSSDRYTEAQKATFTKWVNIQLRTIHVDEETSQKIPEIKAIDRDFRDGKRLIQLLHVLFENDPELPRPERGRTRHHYVANVNKVLQFLQTRLDDSGLAALQAIGPVDIVDGNVKLTLGLIWLIISKFRQMVSVFEAISEEALVAEVEANSSPTEDTTGESVHTHDWFDNLVKRTGRPASPVEIELTGLDQLESPMEYEEHNLFQDGDQDSSLGSHQEYHVSSTDSYQEFKHHDQESSYESHPEKYEISTGSQQTLQETNISSGRPSIITSTSTDDKEISSARTRRVLPSHLSAESQKAVADKRLSLPPDNFLGVSNNKKVHAPPARFRTLRLDHSTPMSSSSGILFWINMQLIDYAAILPPSSYPVEDFTGMNDGILLATLIHHKNKEWLEDYDLLIKDGDENVNKEEKVKERLTRCFSILEDRLNISCPKALMSTLIEGDDQNVERLKRTGLAWSVYMSEVFLAMSERRKRNTLRGTRRLGRVVINNDKKVPITQVEEANPVKNKRKKSRGCLPLPMLYQTRPISPMPPWSPKASLLSAIFDWTIGWLLSEYDDDDDDDSDSDNNGQQTRERAARTIRIGKKRSDGSWNIQNASEWKKRNESLSDNEDVPIQLLANVHQPALYTYWD